MKRYGGTLNVHYQVKKVNLKWLHIVWIQIHAILEKTHYRGSKMVSNFQWLMEREMSWQTTEDFRTEKIVKFGMTIIVKVGSLYLPKPKFGSVVPKCTTLVRNAHSEQGCDCVQDVSIWEISVFSSQYYNEPKISLENITSLIATKN